MESSLHHGLRALYLGRTPQAEAFRYGLVAFDLVTISFFVAATMVESTPVWFSIIESVVAIVLSVDYAARFYISRRKAHHVFSLVGMADLVVILSLLLGVVLENLAFLRVLRALRLIRSYHMIHDLRVRFAFIRANEGVIHSTINLMVFIFVVTALVYVLQSRSNPDIRNYLDALYFTVTTLTTTGFGDITLHGNTGRLLSVVIMVVGVALFLRLLQTIFRPHKVRFVCPSCGLNRHDPDAVHCKHCGTVINIETEGD